MGRGAEKRVNIGPADVDAWRPDVKPAPGLACRVVRMLPDGPRCAHGGVMQRLMRHVRVFAIGAAFGLAAYAVVSVLVALSRRGAILQWLAG